MADGWRGRRQRDRRLAAEELARVEGEITTFGERLAGHRFQPGQPGATEEMAADYASALDAYERAGRAMPEDPALAVQALDDGRHALATLDARLAGKPLPERLPLCFFDPRHGRAVRQVRWAPEEGAERLIAVCAADGVRLAEGQRPITTVPVRPAQQPSARRAEPADRAAVRRGQPDGAGRGVLYPSAAAGAVQYGTGARSLRVSQPGEPTVLVVRILTADAAEVTVERRTHDLGIGPLSARIPMDPVSAVRRGIHVLVRCEGRWEMWTEPATELPALTKTVERLDGEGRDVVLNPGPKRKIHLTYQGPGPLNAYLLDSDFRRERVVAWSAGELDTTIQLSGNAALEIISQGSWSLTDPDASGRWKYDRSLWKQPAFWLACFAYTEYVALLLLLGRLPEFWWELIVALPVLVIIGFVVDFNVRFIGGKLLDGAKALMRRPVRPKWDQVILFIVLAPLSLLLSFPIILYALWPLMVGLEGR